MLRAVAALVGVLAASILPSPRAWAQPAAPAAAVGIFERHADIGAVKIPGVARYDEAAQEYTVQASGKNMWAGEDEMHFAWKTITGDFILQARVELLGKGVDPHRKVGLVVRATLEPGSPHVNVARHGDGLVSLQFRRSAGADTEEQRSAATGADVLQLERKGSTYTMSVARFGDVYTTSQVVDIDLGADVHVGIYACAHNPDVSETAVFRNVRLVRPVPDGFVAYREYLGSRVEVLDVATGARRVVHEVPDSIQAPNWTQDGKRLLMNRNGRMYSFDLAARAITPIDTGTMTRNNNDHALSFDGKMLGLSGGSPSVVFTVPATGGTPTQITPVGPSYLHGWSPDGKYLAFTGQRGGDFDVYLVPSGGGAEKRLTTAPGLDDGPEYTPDGEWIYFNSARTGRMQVWRMKPDGSRQEQLTFDDFNNWFPHVSPDGKTIVFITYGPEIAASDHPWYKRVYIRTMPRDGGKVTVAAYVYGGQGSMNVNSWSPDNRQIAFVSNSGEFVTQPPQQRERVAASFVLALGRPPGETEADRWGQQEPGTVAQLVDRHRQQLKADAVLQRAVIVKAFEDAFGTSPADGDVANAGGGGTYVERVQGHLSSLAGRPADYEAVVHRAYRRILDRDAYSIEVDYWKRQPTLSFALLSACVDDWARRNQPGLMATTGAAAVSANSAYLATVRLSPGVAAEARAAVGLAREDARRDQAAGRRVIAPGGSALLSVGGINFVASGSR